ncbi:MAG: Crp/Fnr family transcriptional regulator [Anaerolineae bacterium]
MKIALDHLRTIAFLQGLDDPQLVELAQSAIWREYAPNAVIFLEGEAASAIYYMDFGWIKVSKSSPDGREQILRFLGPGEPFNELSVFANKNNPATAIALEAVGAWLIPREAVRRLLVTHPEVAIHVIENIADRVISLVSLVADLSLHSVETRVARMLLDEATEDVMARRRWATQTELAARLGTVPDVLSRALRSMVDAGVIEMNRHEIRVLDRQTLEEMAMVES